MVHPDGTGLRELTQPTNGDVSSSPVWSPDSTKLLFQSLHLEINGGQEDLWIVNADGTGLFELTNTPENENTPSWGSLVGLVDEAERRTSAPTIVAIVWFGECAKR